MAIDTARRPPRPRQGTRPRRPAPEPRRRRGWLLLPFVGLAAFVGAVFIWSGASLSTDSTALVRVDVEAFGGSLQQAHVYGPGGRAIPVSAHGGRLTPLVRLAPGEHVSVDVVVRRPGWIGWLTGSTERERLSFNAPAAHVTDRTQTLSGQGSLHLSFDQPVRAIAFGTPGSLQRQAFAQPRTSVTIPAAHPGTIAVASSARDWETLGTPDNVTVFPAGPSGSAIANPAPGERVSPAAPLTITFSKPVSDVLGDAHPTLSPATPGNWHVDGDNTLVFTPSGYGPGFGTKLHAQLPRSVPVVQADGSVQTTSTIDWTVERGSTLRLQQLLAEAGYLPLDWHPSGRPVAHTPAAEVQAAVHPPAGTFTWRYGNIPPHLRALWSPGQPNAVTQGAVTAFENDQHMTLLDGSAGPRVWHALIAAAIAGRHSSTKGYSYVYVSMSGAESLTLWHDGKTILTSPANTGIASAPTAPGTFPVYEHIASGTMSGTNPDGSHYNDPGIQWISYFNGGDAVHAFDRASFGSPQSLGCVELPLDEAAQVWPYMPIGTLVTVE